MTNLNMESSGIIASGDVPSGIDTVDMASHMSRMKATKYQFAYYDRDDISQEIWLIVDKIAPKFDPERAKNPKSFFNVATENALKNLRRDTRIADRINIPDRNIDQIDNSFEETADLHEMVEYLIFNIPEKLKEPLMTMINQRGEELSQYMKAKVRKAVERLMERFREE